MLSPKFTLGKGWMGRWQLFWSLKKAVGSLCVKLHCSFLVTTTRASLPAGMEQVRSCEQVRFFPFCSLRQTFQVLGDKRALQLHLDLNMASTPLSKWWGGKIDHRGRDINVIITQPSSQRLILWVSETVQFKVLAGSDSKVLNQAFEWGTALSGRCLLP